MKSKTNFRFAFLIGFLMIIYLDTETTGLYPGQVCQLSYVLQTKNNVKGKNFFFSVDFVEYGAFAVHGFSVDKLRLLSSGKVFEDHIDEIEKDFLDADLVVAHNFSFDYMFLSTEFQRLFRSLPIKESFCSMKSMTPVCKIMRSNRKAYKYPKLAELCQFLDIPDREIFNQSEKLFGQGAGYHDSRFDTTAVYLCMQKVIDRVDFAKLKEKL